MFCNLQDYPESADAPTDDLDPLSPKSPIISPANGAKKLDLPFLDAGSPVSDAFRKEYFIASDATAILEHTKKVMVLEDDDIVHIHVSSIFLSDFSWSLFLWPLVSLLSVSFPCGTRSTKKQ